MTALPGMTMESPFLVVVAIVTNKFRTIILKKSKKVIQRLEITIIASLDI
jgi:hypothetical protein